MQRLYRVAFQNILKKFTADNIQINSENLQKVLREKGISKTDQNIFYRLPREQIKNFLRNPCPVNNVEQLNTEIVTIAKQVRGNLNIVQKKVCFKCPFVASCPKAYIEPTSAHIHTQNALQNLLITMKHIADVQDSNKIKMRSWLSGIRACDSLSAIADILISGDSSYDLFNKERQKLVEEHTANEQSEQSKKQTEDIIKKAKKDKLPLKDIYAKIPQSELKTDNNNDAFIKMAKKYINEASKQDSQQFVRQQKKFNSPNKVSKNYFQEKSDFRRPEKKYDRQDKRFDRYNSQKSFDRQQSRRDRSSYSNVDQRQRSSNPSYRQKRQNNRYQQNRQFRQNRQTRGDRGDRRDYGKGDNKFRQRREGQQENPRIRRFSKDNEKGSWKYGKEEKGRFDDDQGSRKTGKFYQKFKDEGQTGFNGQRKQRQPRVRNEGKYEGRTEGRNEVRNEGRTEGRNEIRFERKQRTEQVSNQQFSRLQRIPKILKTQYVPKQFKREQVEQEPRQGRRVKRS